MNTNKNKSIEICYLWVEKYKAFKNLELNFSNKIEFNKKGNLIEGTNKNVTNGFFGNNITNITAIVGKNGEGKSTIIDFWNEFLNIPNSFNAKFIVILKEKNYKVYYYGCQEPQIVNIQGVEFYGTENKDSIKDLPKKLATIFFSNIFDKNKSIDKGHTKYINMSTNRLIRSVRKKRNGYQLISDNELFEGEELLRQIHFVYDYKNNSIEVADTLKKMLPHNIKLKPYNVGGIPEKDKHVNLDFINKIKERVNGQTNIKEGSSTSLDRIFEIIYCENCISIFIEKVQSGRILSFPNCNNLDDFNKGARKLFEENKELIIDNIMNNMIEEWENFESKEKAITFNYCIEIFEKIKSNFNKLLKEIKRIRLNLYDKRLLEDQEWIVKRYNEQIETIENIIELTKIIKKEVSRNFQPFKEHLIVELETGKKLLSLYSKIENYMGKGWMNITWAYGSRSLSSGENALLNIFSRLYYAKTQKIKKECTSLVILMDEPELYFHPEWQRKLISYLIDFLEVYLKIVLFN